MSCQNFSLQRYPFDGMPSLKGGEKVTERAFDIVKVTDGGQDDRDMGGQLH